MATPDQFVKRLRRLPGAVLTGAARAHRNGALGAIRTVVRTTPVDTRLARSNWVAAIGGPDLSERPIRSAAETVEEAKGVLSVDLLRNAILGSDTVEIHIANGGDKVPYLQYLNAGSSQQAPAGFVGSALSEGAPSGIARTRLLPR